MSSPRAPMPATMMHMPMSVQMIMRHGAAVYPQSRVVEYDGDVDGVRSLALRLRTPEHSEN